MQANDSAQSIFERADKALYTAKEQGRNCVNTYSMV
jgi:PleD family two-component response regulator